MKNPTCSSGSNQPGAFNKALSSQRISAHWAQLCSKIGERRAGSAGDRSAADYILAQFQAARLQDVHAEPFDCVSVVKARAEIAIGQRGKLRRIAARVLAGSPSMPGGRAIETELVWVEMPEQAERLFTPDLRGKVVLLVGPMPTRADLHQRLVHCKPVAVIHVDDRLPFEWVKDDGVYPAWVRRYGMPPTVTIPYHAAWDLRKAGATRVRASIAVEMQDCVSHNLVGEIRGRQPDLPAVLLAAHHDTQCNNTGADDNGSGVVALLELAAHMASFRLLRTIRFVSFGAEEQLSVGSACYARAHRHEISSIGVVVNLDSVSSPLGHHWLIRAGSQEFGSWVRRRLGQEGLDTAEKPLPMPFADHFPFAAFGVPSMTLMRPNMDGGMRWQHHSSHDNLANISVPELDGVIQAIEGLARELARTVRWPFGRGVAPEHRAETRRLARELFGFRLAK